MANADHANAQTEREDNSGGVEHTPGPWAVEPGTRILRSNIMHEGQRVAIIGESTIIDGDPKANARLIAAAPDLLEACKHALTLIWPEKTIEAAIAKAEEGT